MTKLTKEQAIVVTGYTGVMICNFSDFHKDVEERMGTPVWTHQFGNSVFMDQVQALYKDDFIAMAPEED